MKRESRLTFDNDDCFELKAFSDRLERFIAVEHQFVEGSLVLSLNGGFGAGKSTFIEMWKSSLLDRRESGQFVPMPVILNAWESDHCGDPLVAILSGLLEAVENWKGPNAPSGSGFKEAVKDVGWFATGLANEFLAKTVGINAVKAGELAQQKKESRAVQMPDFISLYQERIAALKKLKVELNEVFGGMEPKVVVFVDELDRCRPDYAVSFLETIKHVFDVEGIVFVLAIDYNHLSASAKALFGAALDFEEYFRKFSHRLIELPFPSEDGQRRLVADFVRRYVSVEGRRISLLNPAQGIEDRLTELVHALRMRPRQVKEAFRILGHTMHALDAEREGKIRWGIGAGSMLLSCLRVANPELFQKVRRFDEGASDLCKQLVHLLGKEEASWWVRVILAGAAPSYGQHDFRWDLLSDIGYIGRDPQELSDFFSGLGEAWPPGARQIRKIADMIEHVKSF
jgi:hypothetical protein